MAKMAKNRKEEYKEQNLRYLEEIASQEGVKKLAGGILYKVTEQGSGTVSPSWITLFPFIIGGL